VSLNLQIKTERTAALGVDGHICEIQLILLPFARLKVPGGGGHSKGKEPAKEHSCWADQASGNREGN
jgi:hypothetical protein